MKSGIYAFKLLERLLELSLEMSLIVEKYCTALTKNKVITHTKLFNKLQWTYVCRETGVDEKYS